MARSNSSRRWLMRQHDDPYVREARAAGWRSRAVYKLADVDRRAGLLKPGMTVIDLGAAPGGWSQYAATRVAPKGRVIALDALAMAPVEGVEFIQGDFREAAVLERLRGALAERPADLVLSDMAPNITGVKTVDQPASLGLAELALDLARGSLTQGGAALVKVFEGEGFDELVRSARTWFASVSIRKPEASRARSREVYILARNRRL